MQHAPINDASRERHHQFSVWNTTEGNHDRLPLSTTFLNRSSSREQATHSKACGCRSLAGGNVPVDCTFC